MLYPDDPFRVAPPYQAPGEREPAEPTDEDEKEAERRAIARVLALRTGGNDGRDVVAEALTEGMNAMALRDLTSQMHGAYLDGGEPDHAEIGRIVAGLIYDYAKRVAEARGLIEQELADVMQPDEYED